MEHEHSNAMQQPTAAAQHQNRMAFILFIIRYKRKSAWFIVVWFIYFYSRIVALHLINKRARTCARVQIINILTLKSFIFRKVFLENTQNITQSIEDDDAKNIEKNLHL